MQCLTFPSGCPKMSMVVLIIIGSISLVFQVEAIPPGCRTKCGEVEIPYPFGAGKGCYLDETFEVLCDEATGSVSLAWLSWEVDAISVSTHTLRHKNFTGVTMRFERAGEAYVSHSPSFVGSHYSVSHAWNTFVAMGCDFFVYLADEETSNVQGSCSSLCNINDTIPLQQQQLSTCSGLNCCQISFPMDLRNVTVRVQTMNSWTANWANQCGFFTFVDSDLLRANAMKIAPCNGSYVVPMIHEWAVGDARCSDVRGRGDYLCGDNTDCIDYFTGIGRYRCRCSNGYQGNPYLPQGCQDIDECADPSNNNCPSQNKCVNTAGSYFCLPNRKHLLAVFVPLGTGLAVGILSIAAIGVWAWRKLNDIKARKKKQKFFKRNGGLLLQQQISSRTGNALPEMTVFSIEELDKATDRFSRSRILGKGGIGTVYKGMLSNGIIVAVKKANMVDNNSLQVSQFINEVFILSQINHRHIVKLLGCCLEAEIPLLVYEYVPNGTLSDHLHDHTSSFPWEKRLRIAAEVAGALAYLHSYATTAIFHRDIKSNNILLDQNYKAVLSDFGLSRSVSVDKTHLTTMVGGTFGYLDPQYFWSGRLNSKSDVYGFGVVVAEILTGQKAVSDDDQGLALRFRTALKENRLLEILDTAVALEGEMEEILAVAILSKRCLKLKADKRPSMKEVAAEFEEIVRNQAIRKMNTAICGETSERNFLGHNLVIQ